MLFALKSAHTFLFVGGMVAGLAGSKLSKSKTLRSLTVQGLAQGMLLKDKIIEELANLHEEAEELRRDAKVRATQSYTAEDFIPQEEQEEQVVQEERTTVIQTVIQPEDKVGSNYSLV